MTPFYRIRAETGVNRGILHLAMRRRRSAHGALLFEVQGRLDAGLAEQMATRREPCWRACRVHADRAAQRLECLGGRRPRHEHRK